jgi:hypothetical protein
MKVVTRLIIALAICLMAIPCISSPVSAASFRIYTGGSIAKDEGYIGDTIEIGGSWSVSSDNDLYIYFEIDENDEDDWPNESYENTGSSEEIDAGPPPTYEYQFDRDDIQFTIPECYSGEHEIWICDDDDPDDEVDTLTFTVYPYIEIDEDKGPAGTEVGMTGWGWHKKDSDFEIWLLLDTGEPSSSTLADLEEGTDYVVAWSADDADTDVEIDSDIEHQGTWKEEIIFTVPPASQGEHWVYAVGDENDDIDEYHIKGAPFEVTPSILSDVKSGIPGTEVTVTGIGFASEEENIEISFDGETIASGIRADEDGYWAKAFKVPTAGAGSYTITVEGDQTSKSDLDELKFEIKSTLSMTPMEGNVGTVITISGTGLPASTPVTVTYDNTLAKSGTTDASGTLESITFPATHTQSTHQSAHTVIVNYGSTLETYTFNMESTAPAIPTLKAPADGIRIGIISKVTPTFEWAAVTDPSGVSYNLELATTPDFAQVLIARTELSVPSYSITEIEALEYGVYYWRVKAIDGAMNDSGWSATSSFKVGLLPLWAFITIIALAAVLIIFLVIILLRRGRDYYD